MSEEHTFLTLVERLVAPVEAQTERLTELIGQQREEHRAFVTVLEGMSTRRDRQTELRALQTARLSQLSDNDRVLGEMLLKVAEIAERTEQISGRLLAEFPRGAH